MDVTAGEKIAARQTKHELESAILDDMQYLGTTAAKLQAQRLSKLLCSTILTRVSALTSFKGCLEA